MSFCFSKHISVIRINKNLVAVHRVKSPLLPADKPAYVGMAILDLSKTLMYDFHDEYIRRKHGDRAKLLFTNTDSLTYEIKTDDLDENLLGDKEWFDFRDYPEDRPMGKFHRDENEKVVG